MKRRKARTPIHAAGGIVIRGYRDPLIAVVQLRKADSWVLPKGKLNRGETPLAAARREVLEEVGHKVYIHEFLGTIAYEVGTRAKIVQFWRMQAIGEPVGELMDDVKAVAWLQLADAIDRLTHSREQVFLRNVGPVALEAVARSARKGRAAEPAAPATIPADDVADAALTVETVNLQGNVQELAETAGPSSQEMAMDAAGGSAPEAIVEPVEHSGDRDPADRRAIAYDAEVPQPHLSPRAGTRSARSGEGAPPRAETVERTPHPDALPAKRGEGEEAPRNANKTICDSPAAERISADQISADQISADQISADKSVAEPAAEPPRQDCIKSSGPAGGDGVVEWVRLWLRRLSLASTQLARVPARWVVARRHPHAPRGPSGAGPGSTGTGHAGGNRDGGHDQVAQEGDQESA